MNFKITVVNPASGTPTMSCILAAPFVIGRNPDCDVSIGDPSLSRRHCRMALNAQEALTVTDLDSMNGTYIGDQRIKKANIMPGELIRLGAISLRVEWTEEQPTAPPRTQGDRQVTQPMPIYEID